MKYIFLDTNIFLHFKEIAEIDWLKEASSNRCTLVIAPTVIDELDRKKRGTNRESKRAKKALKKMELLFESEIKEIRPNVFVLILLEKPISKIFEEYLLNQNDPDQNIIASILAFNKKEEVLDLIICSNDTGIRLRASRFSIGKLILNEKYKLDDGESVEQKKIKKLEKQLFALQKKIPEIKLEFENGHYKKEFVVLQKKIFDVKGIQEFQEKKMSEIKEKYPHMDSLNSLFGEISYSDSISKERIIKYNRRLDKYYSYFDKYIEESIRYMKAQELAFGLDLFLVNYGNVPAEDIDIEIIFPKDLEIFHSKELAEPPEPPYPPKKPTQGLGTIKYGIDFEDLYFQNEPNWEFLNDEVSITNDEGYTVKFWKRSLKHGFSAELSKISIFFNDFDSIRSFNAKYSLSASNLPYPINGDLHFIFDIET